MGIMSGQQYGPNKRGKDDDKESTPLLPPSKIRGRIDSKKKNRRNYFRKTKSGLTRENEYKKNNISH